jgi:D-amino-acid oxidase
MYSNWKVISTDLFYRAGAHWRSHAPNSDPEQQQWDTETYNHWIKVLEDERETSEDGKLSGLGVSLKSHSPFRLSSLWYFPKLTRSSN